MVKHYSLKLFGESSKLVSNVLEDIISLFLTIRGYAIARLERNKLHRAGTDSKQSLRQTLKGKTDGTNLIFYHLYLTNKKLAKNEISII
ncbi:hypothetical protein KUTeg_021926 [Tegillarca granosa]|uniref:Uncharacterized protein n=1 Tax=Tegillarca granosa TaxID=220873 RepID=A0ABQ9E947_TEGGR|nr:hypothetical protein KUTeg_021926 [Tegillarca granosa]